MIWRIERDAELAGLETAPASLWAGWLALMAGALQVGVAVGAGYWILHARELRPYYEILLCQAQLEKSIRKLIGDLRQNVPPEKGHLNDVMRDIERKNRILEEKAPPTSDGANFCSRVKNCLVATIQTKVSKEAHLTKEDYVEVMDACIATLGIPE